MICEGSYKEGIGVNSKTGAAECPICGLRFDRANMAGESKRNVPGHSPWPQDLVKLEQEGVNSND